MSNRYRFSIRHKDRDINKIQKEIEDNFATKTEINDKEGKIKKYMTVEPELKDLSDGDRVYYYDGTNLYEYRRINGKLYKSQAYTEV